MASSNLEKILAIERILQAHPYGIRTKDILHLLETQYGITAEKKSIWSNIAVLTKFLPITAYRDEDHQHYYCLDTRIGK